MIYDAIIRVIRVMIIAFFQSELELDLLGGPGGAWFSWAGQIRGRPEPGAESGPSPAAGGPLVCLVGVKFRAHTGEPGRILLQVGQPRPPSGGAQSA
jgi:hypothetical protein